MLELTKISHSYGDRRILADITFALAPGQRIALMGPSGSGKTTLLKIALGLLAPTEGTVRNTFLRPAAVFQEPRLLPWRTAAENVALVLGDRKNALPQALAALERLELEEAGDKYPRELSGGMRQRVAIARALAAEPDLLVLDEPFKGLDEALRRRVLETVGRTEAAVLLVTHEEWEAEALGCQILRL